MIYIADMEATDILPWPMTKTGSFGKTKADIKDNAHALMHVDDIRNRHKLNGKKEQNRNWSTACIRQA